MLHCRGRLRYGERGGGRRVARYDVHYGAALTDVSNLVPHPTDADLAEINTLLDWHAGTLLPDGRLLGRFTPDKRPEPGRIPDRRIRLLNSMIPLKGKRVLEVGCFEGIHTIGLRRHGAKVTAIDVRPQNVIKTMTRLSWHGMSANVRQFDAERITPDFPAFDIVFHFGVLYHMMRPVEHLHNVAPICDYLYLDTHIAQDETEVVSFSVGGENYRGAKHGEGGWGSPFSGKDAEALWLTRASLMQALERAGFAHAQVLQERDERSGPRLLLLAARRPLPRQPTSARAKKATL